MIENASKMISFLKGLRRESGAYAETSDGEGSLRATVSVMKAFNELGVLEDDTQAVDFIRSCRHESGGFSIQPNAEPTPFDTSVGLVCLRTLNQHDLLAEYVPSAMTFMSANAATQFDHFMLVAAYEESHIAEPVPTATIDFFNNQLHVSVAANKAVDGAIAAASILRAGHTLADPVAVAEVMVAAQNTPEGGFGDGGSSSLFATYCVMRTLVLLGVMPNVLQLSAYLDTLKTELGYTDAPGGKTKAGATYQYVSMQTWLRQLQNIPVNAARDGDIEYLQQWLSNGGNPNLCDSEGWTVLLAAASRGQSAVVDLLLNHDMPGALKANPSLRYEAADALPIYMAGQNGDIETVKLLLQADPTHLHAISSVNGHTVLLQAAFYGKEKHLALAEYLLDNAAAISSLPAEQLAEEQAKLLSATNVRGFNALKMQDLWHNQKMKALLLRYYPPDLNNEQGQYLEARRLQYLSDLLLAIATPQALTEKLMSALSTYLESADTSSVEQQIDMLLAQPAFDINRLGGELQMPPLVFAITGVDVGNPDRAKRRYALAKKLLEAGANPAIREKHPMAIGAVIRASVLNNFGLLNLIAEYMRADALAEEMNVSPAVNGLTAMHDAIHRALTSPPAELEGHLAQITWMVEHGARLDIPDNIGQTQFQLAESAQHDSAFPTENVKAVLAAITSQVPIS